MKAKRNKSLFLTTLLLLIAVFISGMFAGRWLGGAGAESIEDMLRKSELDTESYLIEQELIENLGSDSCELADARMASMSRDLWKIGQSLSPEDAEQRLGNSTYRFLKMKYHLMQIRAYIMLYKLEQQCNTTGSVILFYFSRDDNMSDEQGKILDMIVEDFNASVFAVEYGYSEELAFMEEHYRIMSTPSLVIDFSKKLDRLASYDEIMSIIKKS